MGIYTGHQAADHAKLNTILPIYLLKTFHWWTMIQKLFGYVIKGIFISIVLIIMGLLIAHFILENPKSTDVALFILGGVPIVIFLPSVFSSSTSGGLHTPKVIYRKVNTLETKNNLTSGEDENKSFVSPPSLVIAGLLTWLAGFILFMK